MDIFFDKELVFTETFALDSTKTLVVNSDAPINSINSTVEHSSGVFTFPDDSKLADKFILWRAIGQKLFLEERSLNTTLKDNSLCLDFKRSSIIPGTTFFLEKSVLCILVPTQSTIHRFYARLSIPSTKNEDSASKQNHSKTILGEIYDNSREFLSTYHNYYLLATSGHATRAAALATNQPSHKVAYCMAEGILVVVNMPAFKSEGEETNYKQGSLFSRIMGGNKDGVLDVAALSFNRQSSTPSDTFYAVYADGSVKAWNGEQPKVHAYNLVQLNTSIENILPDANLIRLRCYRVGGKSIVIVAIVSQELATFHFFHDYNARLKHLFSLERECSESMLDFDLSFKGPSTRLWTLWNSQNVDQRHSIAYADISIFSSSPLLFHGIWRTVSGVSSSSNISAVATSDEIRACIFNSDRRPFDIVFRAVQITCQGLKLQKENTWLRLGEHVQNYLHSPEFEQKFGERGRSLRQTSIKDNKEEAENKFYKTLFTTCLELENAALSPIGLFIIDTSKTSIGGAVLQDRFTVISSANDELASFVDEKTVPIEKILQNVKTAVENMDSDESDEANTIDCLDDFRSTFGELKKLLNVFIRVAFVQESSENGHPQQISFGGSFSTGFVAARLLHVVRSYKDFSKSILFLLQNCSSFNNFSEFQYKLSQIRDGYGILLSVLQMPVITDEKYFSSMLLTWIFDNCSLGIICGRSDKAAEPYHVDSFQNFLCDATEGSLRSLWYSSSSMLILRCLSVRKEFTTLSNVVTLLADHKKAKLFLRREGATVHPALTYFKAVAYSGTDRPAKAMKCFEEASASVGKQLVSLSSAVRAFDSVEHISNVPPLNLGEYFISAIRHLDFSGHSEEVVTLAKIAIGSLPDGDESLSSVYATLFNHLVGRSLWTDALGTIIKTKDESMRRTTLRDLMSRLFQAKEWNTIASLNYGSLADQAETFLIAAARSQDVSSSPHLFEVVYAFHMNSNDFAKAAQIMYEFALVIGQSELTEELFRRRRDVLAAASNLLDLLPEEERFLYFPREYEEEIDSDYSNDSIILSDDIDMESFESPIKQKKVVRRKAIAILKAKSVEDAWVIANARSLLLATSQVPPSDPAKIVEALTEAKLFDDAFDVCRQCSVPCYDLFYAVGRESVISEVRGLPILPDWVHANKRNIRGREVCDNWSVTKGLLDSARAVWPLDSKPLRAVVTAILSHRLCVPHWLQSLYVEMDIADYLRCLLDFDVVPEALRLLAEYIECETLKIKAASSCSVFMPYTVITELLKTGIANNETELLGRVNKALAQYHSRIGAFESALRFSV